MDFYLLRKGDHANPLRINLNKNEVSVGRNFIPELQGSPFISREHASFKISSDGDWFVTDLNSSNGVYVNRVRVEQPLHRLRLDDCIGLGVSGIVSNMDFEFKLCRMSVKVEPEDDDVIILSDSDPSNVVDNDANAVDNDANVVDNDANVVDNDANVVDNDANAVDNDANEVHKENIGFQHSSIVNGAQKQNDYSNSSDSNSSNSNSSNSSESKNSYKHVYAHILNGKQPVVVLTRCDAEVPLYSQNSLSNGKSLKERKRIIQSSSSSSESDESTSSRKKKSKLSVEKQKVLCNVFSSDASDEDLDTFLKPANVSKGTVNRKQQDGNKCVAINKHTSSKKLSLKNKDELSTSSNSNDSDITLPSPAGFRQRISTENKNLCSRTGGNKHESTFKGKIKASPDFEGIKNNHLSSKGPNSLVDQTSVSHKVKERNKIIDKKSVTIDKLPCSKKLSIHNNSELSNISNSNDNDIALPTPAGFKQSTSSGNKNLCSRTRGNKHESTFKGKIKASTDFEGIKNNHLSSKGPNSLADQTSVSHKVKKEEKIIDKESVTIDKLSCNKELSINSNSERSASSNSNDSDRMLPLPDGLKQRISAGNKNLCSRTEGNKHESTFKGKIKVSTDLEAIKNNRLSTNGSSSPVDRTPVSHKVKVGNKSIDKKSVTIDKLACSKELSINNNSEFSNTSKSNDSDMTLPPPAGNKNLCSRTGGNKDKSTFKGKIKVSTDIEGIKNNCLSSKGSNSLMDQISVSRQVKERNKIIDKKSVTIDKLACSNELTINNNSGLSNTSNSNDSDISLPSLSGFWQSTSSDKKKNLHSSYEDDERESTFKGKFKASADFEEIKNNCFPSKDPNLPVDQLSVSRNVKLENDSINCKENSEIPLFNTTTVTIKTKVPVTVVKTEAPITVVKTEAPLTVLKTETPIIAVKTEVNQDDDDDDDNFGYSQIDEVIIISDDEDYLSFPASQEKNAENVFNLKVEPTDCDDADFDNYMTRNKEKQNELPASNEVNCNENTRIDDNEIGQSDLEEEDEEPYSENIDAIKNFLEKEGIVPKSVTTNQSGSKKVDIKIEATPEEVEDDINSYFPILSQNFFTENEASSSKKFAENSRENNCKENKTEIGSSEAKRNKHAAAVFIEPQPMKYRPRCHRGREEWFGDGQHEKPDAAHSEKVPKQSNEVSKMKKVMEIPIHSKPKNNSIKKKKSIKEKVKEQMGHRIRAPYGGSAIRLVSDQPAHKLKRNYDRTANVPAKKQKFSVPSNENLTLKRDIGREKTSSETASRNQNRFKSRTEFLIEAPPIQPRQNPKKSKAVFKIPKVKPNSNCTPVLNEKTIPPPPPPRNTGIQDTLKSANIQCPIKSHLNTGKIDEKIVNHKINKLPRFPQPSHQLISPQPNQQPISPQPSHQLVSPQPSHQLVSPQPSHQLVSPQSSHQSVHQMTDLHKSFTHHEETTLSKGIYQAAEPNKESSTIINDSIPVRDPRIRNHPNTIILNKSSTPVIQQQQMCVVKPNNGNVFSRAADEKHARLLRLDFDSVLLVILHWNPTWFKEYKRIGTPPNCIIKNLSPLPTSFQSVDEYVGRFYPMILLELWEYIFKEYTAIENAARGKHEVNAICMMVTECISKGDIMVLNCESLVSGNSAFYPREGNLIIVYLYDEIENNQVMKLIGYVSSYNVQKSDSCRLHREFDRRPEAKANNSLLYTFTLKIKKLKLRPALEKLTKACVLCYVANKIRLADGLQHLVTSPLKHDILKPSEKTFKYVPRNMKLPKDLYGSYNADQTSAIVNITEEMKAAYFKCKMILLQGPPGTGKTHTITGLIQNLILDKNVKILVTAPSNAAIDEIGKRLIQLKKHFPEKTLRFVRVGLHKQIHKDLLPYTVESLAVNFAGQNTQSELDRLRKTLKEKIKAIEQLQRDIDTKSRRQTVWTNEVALLKDKCKMEIRRKNSLLEEIERIKRKDSSNNHVMYTNKLIVLEKANVILSTLGSCRLKILEKVFGEKSKTHFTCCIVDEAAQCTEPEIMQLLVFGLSKFVLVGDHQQLPATVYSKLAIEMNYNISLFERIHIHFQKQHLPSPILMLTEQYRMHSDICAFPAAHFYSNRLCTAPYLDRKYDSFPLKPFFILNINDSRESNAQSSKQNFPEADTIFWVCEHLRHIHNFNRYSVGIITPYQGQKGLILSKFKDNRNFKHIEVNTVDSFQGREKDIIILSCVRARSQDGSIGFVECGRRLNVAITRARKCVIICGHMNSLSNDADWRALISNSQRRELYITVTSNKDIPFIIDEMKKSR